MATSADAFLADLEDLEEDLGYQNAYDPHSGAFHAQDDDMDVDGGQGGASKRAGENLLDDDDEDEEDPADAPISNMLRSAEFKNVIAEVCEKKDLAAEDAAEQVSGAAFTEDDPEYKLVSRCNTLVKEIDEEMFVLYTEVKAIFQTKFPQLENILVNPFDYLSVVQRMADECKRSGDCDISKMDFTDILPNQLIMTMTITATHSKTAPLEPRQLAKAVTACDEAFQLNDHKRDVLLYLESRMSIFCPNLATLLSPSIAAKLVTAAGGLLNLSRMPAQNIMLIGAQKRAMLGLAGHNNQGLVLMCDLIQSSKPEHRSRAIRLVAGKSAIAARCDWHRTSQLGETGAQLRESIQAAMAKAALPPPAKQKKALPRPDDVPCKKRGGKRHRALKEKYAQTVMQKQQNRVKFGEEPEPEIAQEKMGFGLGMISVTSTRGGRADYVGGQLTATNTGGSGKVKAAKQKEKQRNEAAMKRQRLAAGAGVRESGMSSSLAFTPVQGIELVNPVQKKQTIDPADRYFANSANFVSLNEQ
ncbi:unnamed protein product [Amoebophrya sp. A25]|nr:unnamed protein product [Amoebophrya sp. A25]|eukprot:GSA25T00008446001.1